MLRSPLRRVVVIALLIGLTVGLSACGGSDDQPSGKQEAVLTGDALPDGFPSGDLPLIDGELSNAIEVSGEGYLLQVTSESSAEEVFAQAAERLAGAGFTLDESLALGKTSGAFVSKKYDVLVTAVDSDGSSLTSYTITIKP
jgi:hypothetical protein